MARLHFTRAYVVDIVSGRKTDTLRAKQPQGIRKGDRIELCWRYSDKPFAIADVTESRSWRLIDISARRRRQLEAIYDPLPARVWRVAFKIVDWTGGAVPDEAQGALRAQVDDHAPVG